MFDGLALIKWRPNKYPLNRVHSHLSINSLNTNSGRPRSMRRGSADLHSQHSPSIRNSHDFSRTGSPPFHNHRLSDEEIEEKDEFSYGFSNRRNSHQEDMFEKDFDDARGSRHSNQFTHTVSGFETHNQYYD